VNKVFKQYNEFISLTFRSNDFKKEIDIPFYSRLAKLAKNLELTLPPRRFLTMDTFKSGSRTAI